MTSYLTSSTAPNLSLWSFPAVLLLAAIPHWLSIQQCLSKRVNGGWKNQNPRGFVAQLHFKEYSGKKLSDLEKKVIRAQAGEWGSTRRTENHSWPSTNTQSPISQHNRMDLNGSGSGLLQL